MYGCNLAAPVCKKCSCLFVTLWGILELCFGIRPLWWSCWRCITNILVN